jgi:hypothetical protein
MKTYKHKLFAGTYTPLRAIDGGVEFKNIETGELRQMTNHQIARLLVVSC